MGGHRISRGTFAFMAVAGFSVNMLTLFALVLVIGTVVDDSIVVVEAVQARFDAGYRSAYKASVDAMNGLTSALFTTTLVFMVIFIPVSFVSGTSGTFYKQFGLTMAFAVGTVGGMLIGTLGLLFVVPALFVLFQTLQERFKPVEFAESDDPLIVEEMKKIEVYRAAKE